MHIEQFTKNSWNHDALGIRHMDWGRITLLWYPLVPFHARRLFSWVILSKTQNNDLLHDSTVSYDL